MPLRFRAAAFALLALLPAIPAHSACPEGSVVCGPAPYTSTSPRMGSYCTEGSAFFSIPEAQLVLYSPPYDPRMFRHVVAHLHDEFTVLGPGPATSYLLRLRVRVRVQGFSELGAPNKVTLALNLLTANPTAQGNWSGMNGAFDIADSLDLAIPRTGVDPIDLTIEATQIATDYAQGTSTLEFTFVDLPPGWAVISCNGYRQEPAVAAAPRSWGSLKAAYR